MSPPRITRLTIEGATMHKLPMSIHPNRSARTTYLFLACGFLLLAATLSAQAPDSSPNPGVVRQLSEVKFPPGDGPNCLQFFLETGDLKTGPASSAKSTLTHIRASNWGGSSQTFTSSHACKSRL